MLIIQEQTQTPTAKSPPECINPSALRTQIANNNTLNPMFLPRQV